MSELYLVRHAQASFGSDNYDQLSPLGFHQANLLGEHFEKRRIVFDRILTGSLQRQKQTLEGICKTSPDNADVPVIEFPQLDEYHFIDLNRSYAELYPGDELVLKVANGEADKSDYFRLLRRVLICWSQDELDDVAELFIDFKKRINLAKAEIQQVAKSETVLAISSGGIISQFVGSILETPPEQSIELNLQMRNASISRLYFNQSSFKLSSFNATPHLESSVDNELITYG